MKTKHDTPYYKKVYSRDTKNLKILIGHGGKTPKYAKKGGPFNLDPPKRRPVGKLSAPPMVLDEDISPELRSAFMNIKDATIKFKTKKDIPLKKDSVLTAFKKGVFYNASIKDDQIKTETNLFVDKELSKQEFLSKLGEQGEICNVLDCDATTVTVKGQKSQTLRQMMKAGTETAGTETAKGDQTTKKPKTELQKSKEKQNKTSASVVASVAKDGNVKGALEKDFFKNYKTSPYHPLAKEFANTFYDIVDESLKKIPNVQERQIAALTAVVFGTIGMNAASAIAETAGVFAKKDLELAASTIGSIIGLAGGKFQQLSKLYDKIIKGEATKIIKDKAKKVKDKIKKTVGGGVLSLPNGQGKKILFLGNSQTVRVSRVLKGMLANKNYDTAGSRVYTSGKFDLVHSGDTSAAHPSYYHKGSKGYNTIQRLIKKLGGADKIGLISVNMGDAQKVGTWQSATDKMIKDLRGLIPDVAIFWMGAPPIQKKVPKTNARRKRNTLDAQRAVEKNGGVFINPFNYLGVSKITSKALYVQDPEMVHLNTAGIAKVLAGSVADNEEEEKKSKPKTQGSVEKIRYEGRRAVKLPSGEIRAGGTPAWRNNNPGNLKLRTAWRFYGAVGRVDGFAVFPTPEAGEEALDKYLDTFAWSGRGPAGGYTIKTYFKMHDEPNHIKYSNFVAKRVGVDVDTKTKNLSNRQKRKFKEAIKRMEGYKEGDVIPA